MIKDAGANKREPPGILSCQNTEKGQTRGVCNAEKGETRGDWGREKAP